MRRLLAPLAFMLAITVLPAYADGGTQTTVISGHSPGGPVAPAPEPGPHVAPPPELPPGYCPPGEAFCWI